jgi:hypothetical protein
VPNHLAAILASVILCQGCYLGHSRVGKTIAYATNGAISAGGIALVISAHVTRPGFFDLRPQVQEVGVIALFVGLCGIVANLIADASPPAMPPARLPSPAPPGSPPMPGALR